MLPDRQTLVLDVAYQPVTSVTWMRAVTLLCQGKAELLSHYAQDPVRGVRGFTPRPAVIRYLNARHRWKRTPRLNKRNLLTRDHSECQYCYRLLNLKTATYDHVLPKSRGGRKIWTNIVLSCKVCNSLKKDMTLREAGMSLKILPATPKMLRHDWLVGAKPEWLFWLGA